MNGTEDVLGACPRRRRDDARGDGVNRRGRPINQCEEITTRGKRCRNEPMPNGIQRDYHVGLKRTKKAEAARGGVDPDELAD